MAQMKDRGVSPVSARERVLVMGLLFLVSLFNSLDRHMLAILLPSIKVELRLSDAELGFISGTAFTILYAIMGIPIGRLADRRSRRAVIAGALAFWSTMTAMCGLVQGFVQLALARVMVGIGEAGATPPSLSLISDLFPARSRARAVSIYAMGLPLGVLIGFMGGGIVAQSLGWRMALIAFGLPGLGLAAGIYMFLPEPVRGASDGHALLTREPLPLRRVIRTLFARKSFLHVCLGSSFYTLAWLGMIAWLPSYFTRTFGLPIGEVGAKLALSLGLSQLIGLGLGGVLGDRLARIDGRWYLWICAAASLLPVPLYLLAMRSAQADAAFLLLFPALAIGMLQGGPAAAIVQGVAGPRMRGVGMATYLMIVNLISGLGAQLVGLLSDRLAPWFGAAALGDGILSVAVVFSVWSSWHFWCGSRALRSDAAAALAE